MSGTHADQLQAIINERDRYKAALIDISKGHLGPCPYVQKARETLGIAGVEMPLAGGYGRLVAAAPDLLRACESMLIAYETPPDEYCGQFKEAAEQAYKAIAKAKGHP